MCGIVGYIYPNPPVPIIIEGLRRLEYRGYDSAGIAIAGGPDGKLQLRRAPGKLRNLEALISDDPLAGTFGIGHTRWATHGRPTEENAHPHRDGSGTLVVVHNGIVENYLALKAELIAKGHKFVSETDTEIIAHLIENEFNLAAEVASKYGPQNTGVILSGERSAKSKDPDGVRATSTARTLSATESPDANNAESVLTLSAAPSIPLEEARSEEHTSELQSL